jgi:CheY-like chemotaxis protein
VPPPSPRRVLIVDDNADSAESLAALLRMLGHEPRSVTDPRLAMDAALEFSPSIAFIDIGMPHINGYELARALRERFGTKLCLVALTAYGSAGDRQMSRSVGFDAHLLKPADIELINEALSTLFGKS